MLRYLTVFLFLTACSQQQQYVSEIPAGKIFSIKTGKIIRIKEVNVLSPTEQGIFASMADKTAEIISSGLIGAGVKKLTGATGSKLDSAVEAIKMLRVRVKLDDSDNLVEILQEVSPNLTFKVGQDVIITQGDGTAGNVWPD